MTNCEHCKREVKKKPAVPQVHEIRVNGTTTKEEDGISVNLTIEANATGNFVKAAIRALSNTLEGHEQLEVMQDVATDAVAKLIKEITTSNDCDCSKCEPTDKEACEKRIKRVAAAITRDIAQDFLREAGDKIAAGIGLGMLSKKRKS